MKHNVLSFHYFASKAALERALERESRVRSYNCALIWDLQNAAGELARSRVSGREGVITQFRSMLRATNRKPYVGYAVALYQNGAVTRVIQNFESLSLEDQQEALTQSRLQRATWRELLRDPQSTIRHL